MGVGGEGGGKGRGGGGTSMMMSCLFVSVVPCCLLYAADR